jgi:hypothetical protein
LGAPPTAVGGVEPEPPLLAGFVGGADGTPLCARSAGRPVFALGGALAPTLGAIGVVTPGLCAGIPGPVGLGLFNGDGVGAGGVIFDIVGPLVVSR